MYGDESKTMNLDLKNVQNLRCEIHIHRRTWNVNFPNRTFCLYLRVRESRSLFNNRSTSSSPHPSLPSKLDPKDSSVYTCNIYRRIWGECNGEIVSFRFVRACASWTSIAKYDALPYHFGFLAFFVGEVSLFPPP